MTPVGERSFLLANAGVHLLVFVLLFAGVLPLMAAAVADFRPAQEVLTKIKKSDDGTSAPVLELVRNPDVLADLVAALP